MESPLLRELKGLLVSSPEESVRLQKESPLLRELEGLLVSSPVESVRLQKEKDLFWESPLLGS